MPKISEVPLPDIGDFKEVDVIEVLVSPGEQVNAEQSLITLESDKATLEVPSPQAGKVLEVKVKVGDKVSQGTPIVSLEVADEESSAEPQPSSAAAKANRTEAPAPQRETRPSEDVAAATAPRQREESVAPRPPPVSRAESVDEQAFRAAHASPSVRRFARELGVDLGHVQGAGPKGRILKGDVEAYVRGELAGDRTAATAVGLGVAPMPEVDFSAYGETELRPLNKIRRLSGANLHRNWVSVPHVTQFEAADITELEAFRKAQAEESERRHVKLTFLAFLMKAAAAALKEFPDFNSSLDSTGEALVLKKYCHIGVAVDTTFGLVVPVIRDVDRKGLFELAAELAEVSSQARERRLSPADMQGGCFTISSLGGIGGTAFTPIVNVPEVAILGVSRAAMRPVYRDGEFVARLILPFSLSYDHRVIDGAAGARFAAFLSGLLSDIRRLLL